MSAKDTGTKEMITGLLDQLAEPSVTEPIGCVWDELADDLSALPTSLSDQAASAFRDALKPADSLGPTTQWTGRDWAKASLSLAAWSRSKTLGNLGKPWIQKAGGTAPESADAGAKELCLVLYKKLLEPVRPGAATDRLSARQRAVQAAFLTKVAKDIGVNLSEKSERRALNETPDAFVGELIRRGLLEKGAAGGPGSVVAGWPTVLDDAVRYRDSFWQELRELIEPVGRAALPTAAAALLIGALLIGLLVTYVQYSKRTTDFNTLTVGLKAEFSKDLEAAKAPLVKDYLDAVGNYKKAQQAKDADNSTKIAGLTADLTKTKGTLEDTVATTTKKITDLEAARTSALKAKEAAQERGDALKKDLDAATAEKTRLAGELDKAVAEAKTVLAEKNKVIADTTDKLKATTTERDKLKTDLGETSAKLAAANTKIADEEKKLAATSKSLADAQAKVKSQETELTNLNEGLRVAAAKLTDAQKKQAETDKSLAAAKSDLAAAGNKQADTEKSLTAAKTALTASEAKVKSLTEDAGKASAALTASETKAKTAAEDAAKAHAAAAAAEEKVKTLTAGAAKAAAEIKTLRDDLASVTKERDELKKKASGAGGASSAAPGNRGKDAPKGDLLGAVVRNISDEDRKALNLAADVKGVIVHEVKAGTPAAAAGLHADEVVVELRADFAVGTQTVSQDASIGDLAGVTAFTDRVATLKRDNKLKGWKIKTSTRSVTVNE